MPKYTNRHNIPPMLAEALIASSEEYSSGGADISVTAMIGSPIISELRRRHGDGIVIDVVDLTYQALGTGVHRWVDEKQRSNVVMSETRLNAVVNEWNVSGQLDAVDSDGILSDLKTTSAYAFILGPKPDWHAQLNCYSWLLQNNGFDSPTGLRIVAILRDWSPGKAKSREFPAIPIQVVDVPQWPLEVTQAFISARVATHQFCRELSDDSLPICTPFERWQRPAEYAVKKKGNIRASRVLQTEDAAYDWIAQHSGGNLMVEKRESEPRRCLDYCDVAAFCPFGQRVRAGMSAEQAAAECPAPIAEDVTTAINAAMDAHASGVATVPASTDIDIQTTDTTLLVQAYFGMAPYQSSMFLKSPHAWRRIVELTGKEPGEARRELFPDAEVAS